MALMKIAQIILSNKLIPQIHKGLIYFGLEFIIKVWKELREQAQKKELNNLFFSTSTIKIFLFVNVKSSLKLQELLILVQTYLKETLDGIQLAQNDIQFYFIF